MQLNNKTLPHFEADLISNGYKCIETKYKEEDYGYWKSFDITDDGFGNTTVGYQIGFLIYDFGKYPMNNSELPISISFEYINCTDSADRLCLSMSDSDMTQLKFEKICASLYHLIQNGFLK